MQNKPISRRDFLNGCAIGVAAGAGLPPLQALAGADAAEPGDPYYPPALTGMRGSSDGSFETAHAVAWKGQSWPRPALQTDTDYDLVVVGGGISGLAAAYLFRQRMGAGARVLILDNHDDFGGHARRNEFTVAGHRLIGYGGSQSIDAPGHYSKVASGLLQELGIRTERFYDYFDSDFDSRHELTEGMLFDDERFGPTRLLPSASGWFLDLEPAEIARRIDDYPVSEATRTALKRLARGDIDRNAAVAAQIGSMRATPVESFLRAAVGMTDEGLLLLRGRSATLWGSGLDTLSVAETAATGMLGGAIQARIEEELSRQTGERPPDEDGEPYIFHFPDGNATIARLLVRSLIPGSIPGTSMEDVVTARADYRSLDRDANAVRIRLNSTAVHVENRAGSVDVVYRRAGNTERVRAGHCVLACYNRMIPYICPEVPVAQRDALAYPEKIPLLLINVALRNWQPLARSGIGSFYSSTGFLTNMGLDFPVSMGDYAFTSDPAGPALLQGWHVPALGRTGTARERFRGGCLSLLQTSFAAYEAALKAQLDHAWGNHGLDVERDIAAITVNRWPHGYAYEYMDLWDDPAWGRGAGPHVIGRQQLGRISIANSDSEQYAYANGAIDAAYRAVREQTTGT